MEVSINTEKVADILTRETLSRLSPFFESEEVKNEKYKYWKTLYREILEKNRKIK